MSAYSNHIAPSIEGVPFDFDAPEFSAECNEREYDDFPPEAYQPTPEDWQEMFRETLMRDIAGLSYEDMLDVRNRIDTLLLLAKPATAPAVVMGKRNTSKTKQPPMPGKGASPAEIKAWVAECQAQATLEEQAEYEATGDDLKAIFDRIGFDPKERMSAQSGLCLGNKARLNDADTVLETDVPF